jgi:hypothetical protein
MFVSTLRRSDVLARCLMYLRAGVWILEGVISMRLTRTVLLERSVAVSDELKRRLVSNWDEDCSAVDWDTSDVGGSSGGVPYSDSSRQRILLGSKG